MRQEFLSSRSKRLRLSHSQPGTVNVELHHIRYKFNNVISIWWWTLVSYLLRQLCPKTAEREGKAQQQAVDVQCLCQISAVFQTLQKRSSVECTVLAACMVQFKFPKGCSYIVFVKCYSTMFRLFNSKYVIICRQIWALNAVVILLYCSSFADVF